MAETIDLLVEGDFLLPMTDAVPVITGAEVAVRDGRIVHAGPARPAGSWTAARTIRALGHAILPGFVNAHCHTASIVFRSQTDDPPGGITLYTIGFRGEQELNPEEWHDLGHVGAIDMVKAGVTTINDIYYEPDGLAAACAALGLRAQLCDEIFDVAKENLVDDWMMNDPFEGMRNALNALRLRTGKVEALTTAEALWFATMGSARVLGLDREIGSLEPGKKADLILVHLERPHLEPFYGDPASIVYYARAADVVTSIVDGRVIMEDRRVIGLDETATLARARRHLPRFSDMMRRLGGVSRLGACPCGAH